MADSPRGTAREDHRAAHERSDCAPSSSIEMGAASGGKGAAPAATRATSSGGEDATSAASAGDGAVRTRASRATSVLAAS